MFGRLALFEKQIALYRRVYGRSRGVRIALGDKLTGHAGGLHPAVADGYPEINLRSDSADVETYLHVFHNLDYDLPISPAPRTIIDAGAHVGLASIWFARQYPDARIVAVELHPQNYELLVRNTREYPNIQTLNAALWPDGDGRVTIDDPGIGNWGYQATTTGGGPSVDAVTILQIMARFDLERVGLLKLDIEGAERAVLTSADGWIDRVDAVVAELHDRMLPGCSRTFFRVLSDFTEERWQGENVLVERPHRGPLD